MATKTNSNTRSRASTTKKAASAHTTTKEPAVASVPVNEVVSEKQSVVPKQVDLNQIITVRNGFQGTLVYVSKKTGETFVWDSFGDEQDMELGELRNARNASKDFFVNNWFMFDEDWIVDFLGVSKFYKNALPIDNFDDIFEKSPEELAGIISGLSEGQKRSVAYRASKLIAEEKIDSNRVITTLEKCLDVELIER